MVPWILIIPSDTGLPLQFKRIQYLNKLAFAMAIYRAQGQSMSVVDLNMSPPSPIPLEVVFPPVLFLKPFHEGIRFSCTVRKVYSHGQFYVGVSQVGSPQGLFILCKEGSKKQNIVVRKSSPDNHQLKTPIIGD